MISSSWLSRRLGRRRRQARLDLDSDDPLTFQPRLIRPQQRRHRVVVRRPNPCYTLPPSRASVLCRKDEESVIPLPLPRPCPDCPPSFSQLPTLPLFPSLPTPSCTIPLVFSFSLPVVFVAVDGLPQATKDAGFFRSLAVHALPLAREPASKQAGRMARGRRRVFVAPVQDGGRRQSRARSRRSVSPPLLFSGLAGRESGKSQIPDQAVTTGRTSSPPS